MTTLYTLIYRIPIESQRFHYWFTTLDKAVETLMNDFFHTDKDEEWRRENEGRFFIEEHNGDLYWQCNGIEYTETNLLFGHEEEYEENPEFFPHTIAELREYITDNPHDKIIACATTQSPIYFRIDKMVEYAQPMIKSTMKKG